MPHAPARRATYTAIDVRLLLTLLIAALAGCGDDAGGAFDASGASDAADRDAPAVDGAPARTDAAPTCPETACPSAPAGLALGDPLAPTDGCAFALVDDDSWTAQDALVDQLEAALTPAPVADVLADLNRQGSRVAATALSSGAEVDGVAWAFGWNSGDRNVAYWIPQGLTGSTDASADGLVAGKRLAVATWYYNADLDPQSPGDKGVRISLADITDLDDINYRLLLLVEPYDDGGRANLRAIPIHAGGAAWYGPYLYVADTGVGLRVFDTRRILRVATGKNLLGYDAADDTYYAYGYKYVVPQVGRYRRQACSPRFSFVALDRSSSPPSLLSGEYDSGSPAGRLFRWPLDPATHRLASATSYASEAFYLGYSHVQGAVAHDGQVYLSSSEPPSGRGAVVRTSASGFGTVAPWTDGPEDLVFDVGTGTLWGLGEHAPDRYVFAASAP
jgi:hypothetical protein